LDLEARTFSGTLNKKSWFMQTSSLFSAAYASTLSGNGLEALPDRMGGKAAAIKLQTFCGKPQILEGGWGYPFELWEQQFR
jgi:hypothetical protein